MSLRRAVAIVLLLLCADAAIAENGNVSAASNATPDRGIPVSRLIAAVAKRTGRKFVLDPRAQANVVVIGQDETTLSYSDLLNVLRVYGFVAVEDGGYVLVVPDADARTLPVPTLSGRNSRPAAEFATMVIQIRNVPAAQLVPILRPPMPQHAPLAAMPCTNSILISDWHSNVRRLEGIIRLLDTGEAYPAPRCDGKDGRATR